MADKNEKDNNHLDIYLDRYELYQNNIVTTYYEGFQNAATQKRYEKISNVLAEGYLYKIMTELPDVDFQELSRENKTLLKRLVKGITSEVGRALVGVAFLQLTIKSIAPEQSIRLHKGTTRRGLYYLMAQLKNKTDAFNRMAEEAVALAKEYKYKEFDCISGFMKSFFSETEYSARAFEIVIHGFMQAISESNMLGDLELVPISQMRSANKKHRNIGDVELKDGRVIIEAWDAKYGKPYLRDELEELRDKILSSPGVKVAGFIVDGEVDRRKDIINRVEEIAFETGVEIQLLSFDEWLAYQTKHIAQTELDRISERWLLAVVESFVQRRPEIAPIDEPCEAWVQDLIKKLNAKKV